MRQSIPRIRSIKMKNGGAQIYLVPKKAQKHHEDVCKELVDYVTTVLKESSDLAGFGLALWDSRGASMAMYFLSEENPFSSDLLPMQIHDTMQGTVNNARTREMLED